MRCRLLNARHNLIAHPVAGVLWLFGFDRWGDWVHDRW
jgi:hypothetical protein